MFRLKLLYRVSIVMGLGLITFGVSACQPQTPENRTLPSSPPPISNDPQSIPQKQSKIALVIGNANYEERALSNPVNDATDMANALRELGFEVTLLTNLNHEAMENAIGNFRRQLRQGGVGVFYYAGHGIQVKGQNYLIPLGNQEQLNYEERVPYHAVSLSEIVALMQEAQTQVNIIMIDACRDNPWIRKWRSNNRSSTISRGLTAVAPPSGMIIAYATRQGDVASDGEIGQRNSPFTSALLQFIKKPNDDVRVMFGRVSALVRQKTGNKQEPWTEANLFGDEFFLNPQSVATSPQSSPTLVVTTPTREPSPSVAIIPTPSPSTPSNQPRSPLISSTTGVNYTSLRRLLSQKKWREADQLTWYSMLAAANRQQQRVFDSQSIYTLACEDLRMIDQEWLNASGGKFGFSVQLKIYKQTGNITGSYNQEAYGRFEDTVGWINGVTKNYDDSVWGRITGHSTPKGHFPTRLWSLNAGVSGDGGTHYSQGIFSSRIAACEL